MKSVQALTGIAATVAFFFSLGAFSPVHANLKSIAITGQNTVKKFGQWQILWHGRTSSGYPPVVELSQTHNQNENEIGDMIFMRWSPRSEELGIQFQIFCDDDLLGGLFSRDGDVKAKHWLSIGASAATVELKTMVNGWMKEAKLECARSNPAQIFKWARAKRAITLFLENASRYEASEKKRETEVNVKGDAGFSAQHRPGVSPVSIDIHALPARFARMMV